MESVADLTGIAIVALAALLCGLAMARLGQPAIVGYILAGVLLGPGALGVVHGREEIASLAELGVLLLLFVVGMELSIRAFMVTWRLAATAVALQIGISVLAMLLGSVILGFSTKLAVLLGFFVALSSTAVAIKVLEDIGQLRTRVGRVTVSILIAQDLAFLPMLLIVDFMGTGFGFWDFIHFVVSIGLLAVLLGVLNRRRKVDLPFANIFVGHADLSPLTGLVYCFGAGAIFGLFGLSAAYGAFVAGLIIGNSAQRKQLHNVVQPVQSILVMVFFLSIGLLVDLNFIWENLGTVLLLLLVVTLFKTAMNVGIMRALGEPWQRAFLDGVVISQIGEFSFLLAASGLAAGAIDSNSARLAVAVTVLSLGLNPLWLATARRSVRIVARQYSTLRDVLDFTYAPEKRALRRESDRMKKRLTQVAGDVATRFGASGDSGEDPAAGADTPETVAETEKKAAPDDHSSAPDTAPGQDESDAEKDRSDGQDKLPPWARLRGLWSGGKKKPTAAPDGSEEDSDRRTSTTKPKARIGDGERRRETVAPTGDAGGNRDEGNEPSTDQMPAWMRERDGQPARETGAAETPPEHAESGAREADDETVDHRPAWMRARTEQPPREAETPPAPSGEADSGESEAGAIDERPPGMLTPDERLALAHGAPAAPDDGENQDEAVDRRPVWMRARDKRLAQRNETAAPSDDTETADDEHREEAVDQRPAWLRTRNERLAREREAPSATSPDDGEDAPEQEAVEYRSAWLRAHEEQRAREEEAAAPAVDSSGEKSDDGDTGHEAAQEERAGKYRELAPELRESNENRDESEQLESIGRLVHAVIKQRAQETESSNGDEDPKDDGANERRATGTDEPEA